MSTAINDPRLILHPVAQCCSLTDGPIDAEQADRFAGMLKALADPTRLRLLSPHYGPGLPRGLRL